MAKLRIAGGEVERAPVAEAERHLAACDPRDFGGGAVDEPEPGVVAGPADAVAGAKLHLFGPIHLDPARARSEPVGLPGDGLSVLSLQHHRVGLAVHTRDAQLVALLDPETLVGAVEGNDIAARVVGAERLLGIGVAPGDEPFGGHGGAVDGPVADQALTDDLVDPLADGVARGHEPGIGAGLRGQCEPARVVRRGGSAPICTVTY